MKRVEHEIIIKQASLPEEKSFVSECMEMPDFRAFIGEYTDAHLQEAYLFYYEEERLGVFWPQISCRTGVSIAIPSIYMKRRMSRYTVVCIGRMLADLFTRFQVEKVLVPIYSNNKAVINAMKNYNVFLEGVFRHGLIVEGEPVDICYYSILQEEFEPMKATYREIYGN
ncbi:hypothetical protein [Paenibacillus sp. GCM10012306]|uniref:hypothetical protein n=1 Tax=Paenibacillus sp. GCM10012306 TaxID=3317342 RepID=UPI0036156407